MRILDKRLSKLRRVVEAAPILPHLMKEYYPWFRDFGELPDEHLVAVAVVQRALRGGSERHADPIEFEQVSVRDSLFEEALFDPPPMRAVARAVIATEVAYGGNVESPAFASHHGLPIYGKVSLHVLGWPRMLVKEPYEDQAKRLLVRLDGVRARVASDNDPWLTAQAQAQLRFYATGELPKDELHRDGVLVSVELDLLWAHHRGRDASEGLALFKRTQWGETEEREAAVKGICELAAARKLVPARTAFPRRRTTLST
jgi:hypothetical protein